MLYDVIHECMGGSQRAQLPICIGVFCSIIVDWVKKHKSNFSVRHQFQASIVTSIKKRFDISWLAFSFSVLLNGTWKALWQWFIVSPSSNPCVDCYPDTSLLAFTHSKTHRSPMVHTTMQDILCCLWVSSTVVLPSPDLNCYFDHDRQICGSQYGLYGPAATDSSHLHAQCCSWPW